MEINFEKRYVLIYTFILAVVHHVISNINVIYENAIKSVWPIDAIALVGTLIFISIFNRDIKQRISLGIIYKKTPFEKAFDYVKNDKRIDNNNKLVKKLNGIDNDTFYKDYYKSVCDTDVIKCKNSEYCVIRDLCFTFFVVLIVMIILTIKWHDMFYKELIASSCLFGLGVFSCKMKAKDFVSQIVVEKLHGGDK